MSYIYKFVPSDGFGNEGENDVMQGEKGLNHMLFTCYSGAMEFK